ncbi:MAG: glucose 1-dehydrogenase [Myxococcota bacterium]|jgi:3-oxoacyl-[acyl-carrier protein] reductase|nr:glucose 1-dehydrogenase [Myxococcota bacterium]
MRLEGKTAVITGGGSGIGKGTGECFAAEGARVALLDINQESAQKVVDGLAGEGHIAVACDVSDAASVASAFAEVDAAFGRVDILINNAGVDRTPGDGFEDLMKGGLQLTLMSDDAFRRMLAINVEGVFFCAREAVKIMQREKTAGSIVNLSSIAGLVGLGPPHYAASKGAVLGFTKSCARSLGPLGIRVNAICPGVIETPMVAAVPDAALEHLKNTTPLGRTGQPEDIANLALYLASDESGFLTGEAISPNGGLVIT